MTTQVEPISALANASGAFATALFPMAEVDVTSQTGFRTRRMTGAALFNQTSNAPPIVWYNSTDLSAVISFGVPFAQFIADGGVNVIVAQAIQNQSSATFPAAYTAYGKLTGAGAGNQVFGVYSRLDCDVAGGANNEFDVNNNSANDAPTTLPVANGFGTSSTWPVGLFMAAGGTKKSYAGIYYIGVPGQANQFQYGIYMDKAVIANTAIYLDADATNSPANSLVIKNTGLSTNVPVIIQTLGTYTKANAVWETKDLSGNVVTQFRQDGGIVSVSSPSAASTDAVAWSLTNNSGGSGIGASAAISAVSTSSGATSGASFFATSSAGTLTMSAASSSSNTAALRWSGSGQLFIDALNAAGNIQIRTDATPHNAVTISAAQAVAFPGVGTTASAANAFLDNAASNNLLRSTSSLRYKHSVETLENDRADLAMKLRPVWYRSKAGADRPDWSWYGLIAEEVAAVDPRLVHWSYREEDVEDVVTGVTHDGDGNEVPITERRPKVDAALVPDSVMYDRVSVLLLNVAQRQERRIASLETRH